MTNQHDIWPGAFDLPNKPQVVPSRMPSPIREPPIRPKLGLGIAAVAAGLAIPVCIGVSASWNLGPWLTLSAVVMFIIFVTRDRWIACANKLAEHEAAKHAERSRLMSAYDRLCEETVADETEAAKIVQSLAGIASRLEIGIERTDYTRYLADAWATSTDWLSHHRGSTFSYFAEGAFADYRKALDLWSKVDHQSSLSFFGGGFGVEGALEGIAIASVLNSIASSGPKSAAKKAWTEIHSLWADAAEKITVLRSRTA